VELLTQLVLKEDYKEDLNMVQKKRKQKVNDVLMMNRSTIQK
jgi:hypothetical protein